VGKALGYSKYILRGSEIFEIQPRNHFRYKRCFRNNQVATIEVMIPPEGY